MKKADIKNMKPIFVLGVALLLLTVFSATFLGAGEEPITGFGTEVKYRGSSNTPFGGNFAGKIQTEITICQPTLSELYATGTIIDVANTITRTADFANSFATAAKGAAPLPVPTDGLSAVITASNMATSKFKDETACLSTIGQRYQ